MRYVILSPSGSLNIVSSRATSSSPGSSSNTRSCIGLAIIGGLFKLRTTTLTRLLISFSPSEAVTRPRNPPASSYPVCQLKFAVPSPLSVKTGPSGKSARSIVIVISCSSTSVTITSKAAILLSLTIISSGISSHSGGRFIPRAVWQS